MLVESRKEASNNQSGVRPLIKALSDLSICTALKGDITIRVENMLSNCSAIFIPKNNAHLHDIHKTISESGCTFHRV